MAFWCRALSLSLIGETEIQRNKALLELARYASDALSVVEELRENRSRLIPQNDLLSRAMAREVGAVILSSIVMACHELRARHKHSLNAEVLEAIQAIFKKVEQTHSFFLPKIQDEKYLLSHEVTDRVNDLLKGSLLVWTRFELTQLSDLLKLRQVHFYTIAAGLQFNDTASIRGLVDPLSSTLERRDFIGLMANCILANCFQAAGDLSAQWTCRAGDIALQSNLGIKLKQYFALLAVEKAHAFPIDVSSFLHVLLVKDDQGNCFLVDYLRNCPATQTCGIALRFLNAASSSNVEELIVSIEQISSDAAKQLPQGPRQELEALLDSRALDRAFQQRAVIDSNQILAGWINRKHIWVYPGVLLALVSHGQASEEVKREALALLDRDPLQERYNTYYLLAVGLARGWPGLSTDSAAKDKVLQYIKRELPRWEASSAAEFNVEVYGVLQQLERIDYRRQIAKWQAVHWEREHSKRLPDLIKQGQYFLVFEQYFRWMTIWGLGTEKDPAEFAELYNKRDQEGATILAEWRLGGEIVPAALVKVANRWAVSSEFLLIGSALFHGPLDSAEEWHAARGKFNDAAFKNFRDLIRLVVDLPGVPRDLSELLRAHAERLQSLSTPTGPGHIAVSVVA
jgi:hypothetical protein